MANNYRNICTRKCSLHRGPRFGLRMMCIIALCLLIVPGIFSLECQGVNLPIAVYPQGTISVLYGQPLEVFCVAENSTAEDLYFTLGGKLVDYEKVNSTAIRLYEKNAEKKLNTYYCNSNKTNKHCEARVMVDSVPMNVTDFACTSKNLEILNCTWTSPEKFVHTNYSLTFFIDDKATESKYSNKSGKLRYCEWNTYSYPRYRQQEKQFFFHLNASNIFGYNEQKFIIDHFSVVKLKPPSNINKLHYDAHSVLLRWNIPINADLLPNGVDHRIEYQIAKIDNTSYFHSVNTTFLPRNNKTYKFLLSNLPYAHMFYEVRIAIKPKEAVKEEFWSDFTHIIFETASERPHRPPDTITGAFHQALFDTKRVIYVYWKQLEEYEEAGANFTYKVIVRQSSNSKTIYPEKNKSLSYVVLNNASLGSIDISIQSVNDEGSSINSSHLYVPSKKDTESLRVLSFTKLAYENGTYRLSWNKIKKVDNYTLFWCLHNATEICTGRLNFTVLDPMKTTHVINLPLENRYQFAISANRGTKTSGMVWAICDIYKGAMLMYRFPLKLDHGAPGKSYVNITWTMACTLQDDIITGYLITYCPVLDTSNDCDTKFENKSIYIDNPKQMEINITNLKPYRTYQITLELNTTLGLKKIDNASTRITTIEDTPTSPANVTITDIEKDSLVISWYPPLQKNGIIRKYVIFNYNDEFHTEKVPDNDNDVGRRSVVLRGLDSFTNYSWSVQACNTAINSCSQQSPKDGIFVRTSIGPPSKMKAPTVKNNPDLLRWEPPHKLSGTVDYYEIKIIKDDSPKEEIIQTTDLQISLNHCEGDTRVSEYQVRAVNLDEDKNHGALADKVEVTLPVRNQSDVSKYPGEWSDSANVACGQRDNLTMSLILVAVFFLAGIIYGCFKLYKKYRKMEDIKPVLPNGLGIPEKDISKYAFGGWNPTNKDEKPSSDEMLLLPNSRTTVSAPETKKEDNNCGASDHTDSTALSDTSRGAIERQASTSDDGSDSSLHLEREPARGDENNSNPDEDDSASSDTEIPRENQPYFTKNPTSGYVQSVVNPTTGYVQSAPTPNKSPLPKLPTQAATSSYVMASLSPPIFTTGLVPPSIQSPPPSSGYVRPEDAQTRSMINFPKIGPSPTKMFGPESLPTMPTLPPSAKHGADSSYIQLQSLDCLPSHKQPVHNNVPLKPTTTSSGYVSAGDAVIHKHLNNMLSAGHLVEEPAILDPTMSPDAYCRFSWSTDPANDNLHSLLTDSPTLKTSKNLN